jgi:alkylation response protein AidB-like acyl-CoA dehydrogenase
MQNGNEMESFRSDVKAWVIENFPASLRGVDLAGIAGGESGAKADDAVKVGLDAWRQKLAEKGWGAPTWPVEYGGAGLTDPQADIIGEEIHNAGAYNPIPHMTGMGVTMVGPTLLEYGTAEQKTRHLKGIASGEIRWCLGLSEPNAGSDLASLSTKAQDKGDYFALNGQKVWTSGAHISQWCGALVRTDTDAGKRDGISFVMLPMQQDGVETRPIRLISGISPFCETYFTDARAEKGDLLGNLNDGWSVVKRLLQHERQSQTGGRGVSMLDSEPLHVKAQRFVGTDDSGALVDKDLRQRLVRNYMDGTAHRLTAQRITDEAAGRVEVSAAASILKNSNTRFAQQKAELALEIMGSQGIGWSGEDFAEEELGIVREWLSGKAMSIYGGSYEVQNNIISKNVLGLPETTQKG